ncbi:MAG: molybdopterin-synthase adenylyltransferase MoeB [Rhodospirillaceae bacterium]|nr:molybdopterin-synthase adenylyltransferase MoeB [Rhodospirillaceae bacterium]
MLTPDYLKRYARHIMLPEIGGAGQQALAAASVLVVGAGGLGAPALLYLAAAGVGRLGVADDDVVDLTNLQRQVIHDTPAVGRPKVDSAAERLERLNPLVTVERHRLRVDGETAPALVAGYDLVIDGSDNFATRFLLADTCHAAQTPLVTAAILRFEGQLTVSKGYRADLPCYRCIFPSPPPPGVVPSCAEAGVLGALAGLIGTLQAIEAVKELLGLDDSLAGHLLLVDVLAMSFDKIAVAKDPACPLCGGGAPA